MQVKRAIVTFLITTAVIVFAARVLLPLLLDYMDAQP